MSRIGAFGRDRSVSPSRIPPETSSSTSAPAPATRSCAAAEHSGSPCSRSDRPLARLVVVALLR